MGNIYLLQKQYDKAIEYLLKDIKISEKIIDNKNTMFAYQLLAKIYIANNEIAKARIYLDMAEKKALSFDYYQSEELDILKLKLSIIGNDQKEELEIRKRISYLEDHVKNTDGPEIINQAQLLVQKAKYEGQIDQVSTNLQEASFQKRIVSVISGLLLLILFFLFRYFTEKLKKKSNKTKKTELILKTQNSIMKKK